MVFFTGYQTMDIKKVKNEIKNAIISEIEPPSIPGPMYNKDAKA